MVTNQTNALISSSLCEQVCFFPAGLAKATVRKNQNLTKEIKGE